MEKALGGILAMVSKQQAEYLALYQSGATMQEIATKYGVNKSTVSRVLKRAMRVTCPFSTNCERCPLPKCAIKEEYAYLMNNTEDVRCCDKRRTNRKQGTK